MASTSARIALVAAWLVVIGALAGGAVYLHSLGPPQGPPDLSAPETAPDPDTLPRLEDTEAPAAADGAEEPDAPPSRVTSDAAPPEAAREAEDGSAVAVLDSRSLPQLDETREGQAPAAPQMEAESLRSLEGGATASRAADEQDANEASAVPSLAEMGRRGGADGSPPRFEPQTAWSIDTPSLHGPMPMLPRRPIDLAGLGDHEDVVEVPDPPVATDRAAADPEPDRHEAPLPPTLNAPEATPETADRGAVDPAPAALEPEDDPDQAPEVVIGDADAVPPPQSEQRAAPSPADGRGVVPLPATEDPPARVSREDATADTAAPPAESEEPDLPDGLSTTPVEGLVEVAEVGPLPVVGPAGARPAEVYARPFTAPDDRPVVAVVIGGLGLSSAATEAAIQSLPATVTLSFSPYSGRLQDWIARARAAGHEVLIDLPMEPVDFPHSDPGPQALMTSLSSEDNMQRLEWVLSRATNYVGVGSYMGSRFAADATAMRPVLQAISDRGLIYLDNGQAIGNVAPTLGAEIGLPILVSDLQVDRMAARRVIDEALARVEQMARRDGAALAIGTAYPVTIERLAVWTRALADRGIALAPASSLVAR